MPIAYLSLGSNLGDREDYLRQAIAKLSAHCEIKVLNTSAVYQTEAVGYEEQADFLNLVVEIESSLKPIELLDFTQEIENQLDRTREIRWGPRTIDIDIILFGQEEINSPRLTIPHPRFHKRAFVLVPLAELTKEVIYQGWTAAELLAGLEAGDQGVEEYKNSL
ncbi:2-amino-4-hydroxy-6-hydroxymethyldihydropteridine diphosphokinase [Fuchsiella alkaliacetigena]|uniref:2-amino-4-hydroxy-6- hydroxymethyldihydropteridine diphosphokinase n=1 Tax=Fuchsiella alkaliacetigena TaxID=957042 RepID=UPI00200B1D72|nr:2-amino-4-hydroxy-6-hydroxymethyldihydropteridine diphosphokinase [Fuchsiella alkaliacetigena]